MKKTLFLLMAAVSAFLMVACEPEESASNGGTVSFVSPVAVWADGLATIQITSDYAGEAVTVPVIFGGTAEKDIDYTLSAEAFVIGGSAPVTQIVITPTESGKSKSITATLSAPSDFTVGSIPMCQIDMEGFIGYASFQKASDLLKSSLEVTIQLVDGQGSELTVESASTVEVEIDEEKSTAVEGEHFEFEIEEGAALGAFIDAGKNNGTFKINYLKKEEGHDKLVLKIKETSQFSTGQYAEMEIDIAGPDWDNISGKWVMNEVVSKKEDYTSYWYTDFTFDEFPELNTDDAITIDTDNGTVIPEFQSTFKNYFIGESNMKNAGEYREFHNDNSNMYNTITLQLLELDNINRYFSSSDFSEDKVALVGVRIIQDEAGNDLLDMYVIDYEPHAFLKELEIYKNPEKPVMDFSGAYLNVTFKRAE